MSVSQPSILALDFDGVICNGMSEYFATSWATYCQIWKLPNAEIPHGLQEKFAKYRALIETGWEMPVLIRALVTKVPEAEIEESWQSICQNIVEKDNLNSVDLAHLVDGYRDEWIARDVDSWLALHKFYPGVIDKLKAVLESSTKVVIITTKEGRFVAKLLKTAGIILDKASIFGKEQKQPKSATLKLLSQNQNESIWFVEDRWQTLEKIAKNPDLETIRLYLADWGYNLEKERQLAKLDSRISLISLTDFEQDFKNWNRNK